MEKKFSPEELTNYDGTEGQPSYVAVDGKVYDVSSSKVWRNGQHMKRHKAGGDLSGELKAAPHGADVLTRESIKLVGELAAQRADDHLHPWISAMFSRFPFFRRHPHPMMVHFPIAFLFAAGLFVVLKFFELWSYLPYSTMATAMLILAALGLIPAIATGFIAWWVNYAANMMLQIKRKLQWTAVLVVVLGFAILFKVTGLAESGFSGLVYDLALVFLPINVGIIGYYGAQLTFPD